MAARPRPARARRGGGRDQRCPAGGPAGCRGAGPAERWRGSRWPSTPGSSSWASCGPPRPVPGTLRARRRARPGPGTGVVRGVHGRRRRAGGPRPRRDPGGRARPTRTGCCAGSGPGGCGSGWTPRGSGSTSPPRTRPASACPGSDPCTPPVGSAAAGYASAAVAEVSRRLVAEGERVCLFTDQANPTSNGIYQALGYRARGRHGEPGGRAGARAGIASEVPTPRRLPMGNHGPDVLADLRGPARELRRLIPEVYDGFSKLHGSAMAGGALDAKTKELIALAISVSTQCDGCIAVACARRAQAGRDSRGGRRGDRRHLYDEWRSGHGLRAEGDGRLPGVRRPGAVTTRAGLRPPALEGPHRAEGAVDTTGGPWRRRCPRPAALRSRSRRRTPR